MMKLDKIIHELFDALESKEILWRDFKDVGQDEPYYDYYYAEDRLYLIRDRVTEQVYFVEASSPWKAMLSLRQIHQDIASAGRMNE